MSPFDSRNIARIIAISRDDPNPASDDTAVLITVGSSDTTTVC